ncbi:Uncharacterised protein [Mycoplasmopsis citelli]|uniref:Lipoprotein n=1 Tax=Mycoplasmopsis citelli TaxID=171281 RepID=A0A449B1M0_9BACT|nr:hypothetical protein [Mycoplasmopsis citelli]VEU74463.1 Uncharacterised protein [Mycoplasmopsis citelli]
MSLKTKLFKTILVGFSGVLLTIVSTSCSLKPLTEENYLETVEYKAPYFTNLIRLKQQEQGIKVNSSIIFDQFSLELSEYFLNKNEPRHSNFLEDFQALITSKEDFSHYITSKINSIYEKLKLPKTLSDEEIQKIFENDFLNGQNLNDVLEKNNIWILESVDDRSFVSLNYVLKEEEKDHINIKVIQPFEINDKGLYKTTTDIKPQKSVFNVIVFPKYKQLNFRKTTKDENNQLLISLYNQYHYKEKDFFTQNYQLNSIDFLINNIQRKQGFFNTKNLILKNKIDTYISELPLDSKADSKVKIIKNYGEFVKYVMAPFQINNLEKDFNLNQDKVIKNFETNYLNGQNLNELFKKYNLVVQRTIHRPNTPLNNPAKLVKMPNPNSSQINLALIDDKEFDFNFNRGHADLDLTPKRIWWDFLDKKTIVFYQGLLVPKDSEVKIHGKLKFKETNVFLLANNPLYQKTKPVESQ